MKINKISKCLVELEGEVSRQQFDNALDEAFLKKQPTLELKGFRKGHVTREMFQKHFGDESLLADAIDIAINRFLAEGMAKYRLAPINTPEIDMDVKAVKLHEAFNLKLKFEIWPEVELGTYFGVEVKRDKVNVTSAKINEHINRTLKSYAELTLIEDKEHALENGDIAVIDFEGFLDDKPFEGGKGENHPLEIGSKSFIPGFEEQMLGMKAGEKKTIKVTFPKDYHAPNLKGKETAFKVTVHEIKKRVVPNLDDEFVKKLELKDISTTTEYKKYVKEVLTKDSEEAAKNKFQADVLDLVCKNAQTDVPKSLIDNEVEHYVKQYEEQSKLYKIPLDELLKMYGIEDLEAYKVQIRPNLESTIKLRIVLAAIASKEKLEYTDKDYEQNLLDIQKQVNKPLEEVRKEYKKEQIASYGVVMKARDLVISKAKEKQTEK